jgi:tRNA G18 (ribose-2'-O)-methylase SpoU
VPVYTAGQAVMDEIAGFHMHRGILGLGQSAPDAGAQALLAGLPPRAVILVLVGIANHDNMGGLFRNAAAFGVDAVLIDSGSCDPMYRKAIRVSVGAALEVPFARLRSGEDVLALLQQHGFSALALSPAGSVTLKEVERPDRAAVMFGAEGPGLPDALLRGAISVRIPMAGGFDSLNVATSSGIVLHHLLAGE